MLPVDNAHEYTKADALAIDALFKRLAKRGRKIRTQKQVVHLDPAEKSGDDEDISLQTAMAGENEQDC